MKLISMTDFVLQAFTAWENDNNPDCQSSGIYILGTKAYANFLKQPLTLGMFVPVDEEGNVLEEPKHNDLNDSFFKMQIGFHEEKKYIESKSKVLFEGFKICDRRDNTCVMTNEYHLNGFMWKDKTVEMLCSYNVTLTETAIKMIYGN